MVHNRTLDFCFVSSLTFVNVLRCLQIDNTTVAGDTKRKFIVAL